MFNRRFLRIKVLQALYAYYQTDQPNQSAVEKNMLNGLNKTYELYLYVLATFIEFRFFLTKELDKESSKYFPQQEHIHQLKALLNNSCLGMLEQHPTLTKLIAGSHLKLQGLSDVFKNTLPLLLENKVFAAAATQPNPSFADDKKGIRELVQVFIGESEFYNLHLEEIYSNWDDDQVLVTYALLKSIDALTPEVSDEYLLTDKGLNEEDEQFMVELFRQCIANKESLTGLIADKTQNWETDRIAVIDLLLMQMSLCEILYFKHIPVKVSINEYLELAKLYSTPNSHGFINGVLDKIQLELRKQQKIVKTGRGLVE